MSSATKAEKPATATEVDVGANANKADAFNPDVLTKYHTAGEIANEVLRKVIELCIIGADIFTVCKFGDDLIEDKTGKVYTKRVKGEKVRRGVAFPTCVTVNELCANYSPLESESTQLKEGDVVKIDLGVHIDGYIAVAAHTVVLSEGATVEGRKADVVLAAWTAAEAAVRSMSVNKTNVDVTRIMNKCAEEFDCRMVMGIKSHEMKQHVIDGYRAIVSRDIPEEKTETFTFAPYEIYGVDIIVSTGDGKPKESEIRTCVFKRDVEQVYSLKTNLTRSFLKEVTTRFPSMPFSARSVNDERMCRVGISECTRHGLVQPYLVMTEKIGEYTAQFKFTVMILPVGVKIISGLHLEKPEHFKSGHAVKDEEIEKVLRLHVGTKNRKRAAKGTDGDSSIKAAI